MKVSISGWYTLTRKIVVHFNPQNDTKVIIFDWDNFWRMKTLRDFLLPVSLSFLFIPYVWAILTYLAYEHITWRFHALPIPTRKRGIFMLRAFWEFGFRYHEVRNWWRYSIQTQPKDYESLLKSLAESKDFVP